MEGRRTRLRQYIAVQVASGVSFGPELEVIINNAKRDYETFRKNARTDRTSECSSKCEGAKGCYEACIGINGSAAKLVLRCLQGDLGLPF